MIIEITYSSSLLCNMRIKHFKSPFKIKIHFTQDLTISNVIHQTPRPITQRPNQSLHKQLILLPIYPGVELRCNDNPSNNDCISRQIEREG